MHSYQTMKKRRILNSLPVFVFLVAFTGIFSSNAHAGSEVGAQIYCVMRDGGNEHEPSWQAAYEAIKHNKAGLFKTSPKHAAVMIVDAVVRDPEKYEGCIGYLGDIYPSNENKDNNFNESEKSEETPEDRYSY